MEAQDIKQNKVNWLWFQEKQEVARSPLPRVFLPFPPPTFHPLEPVQKNTLRLKLMDPCQGSSGWKPREGNRLPYEWMAALGLEVSPSLGQVLTLTPPARCAPGHPHFLILARRNVSTVIRKAQGSKLWVLPTLGIHSQLGNTHCMRPQHSKSTSSPRFRQADFVWVPYVWLLRDFILH